MANKNYRFETLQLHVGQEQADPATDSRAVPIYQTTSVRLPQLRPRRRPLRPRRRRATSTAASTNSTQGVLEGRIAALEGGAAGLGRRRPAAAAVHLRAAGNLAQAGRPHRRSQEPSTAAPYNLLRPHPAAQIGVTATFVAAQRPCRSSRAAHPGEHQGSSTFETLGNPNADLPDIDAVAADRPHATACRSIVDNTFATPVPGPPARARRRRRGALRHQVHRRPRHHPRRRHRGRRHLQLGRSAGQVPGYRLTRTRCPTTA